MNTTPKMTDVTFACQPTPISFVKRFTIGQILLNDVIVTLHLIYSVHTSVVNC